MHPLTQRRLAVKSYTLLGYRCSVLGEYHVCLSRWLVYGTGVSGRHRVRALVAEGQREGALWERDAL